jgi:hypothetical protein
MALLRKASTATKRIFLTDDETEWIEVRGEVSKRDRNRLFDLMPSRPDVQETGLTPQEGLAFQTDLFVALVTGWSLDDEVTAENYLSLEPEGTDMIDTKLAEHFATMVPTKEEVGKA